MATDEVLWQLITYKSRRAYNWGEDLQRPVAEELAYQPMPLTLGRL